MKSCKENCSHRSMIVIRGETRPEAHAAAVISDVNRHGKLSVFQALLLSGKILVDLETGRGKMTFGISESFLIDPWRSLPSRLRVMIREPSLTSDKSPYFKQ